MRFRPEQHLRRALEIRAVREEGKRVDCRSFTLWWRPRPQKAGSGSSRLCLVASRSAVGGAVQRNRAKRRLREVFRGSQDKVPADCDLLLVARADALRRPFADLKERFAEACRRIESSYPPQ